MSTPRRLCQQRGYKFYTPCYMEVVHDSLPEGRGQQKDFFASRNLNDADKQLVSSMMDARMREKLRENRFYLKPKMRRNAHKWRGVLKQRRRDFNYSLRWALKSMTRFESYKLSLLT